MHGPRGIHAQRDAANNWEWMVQDGLGSVRGVADNNAGVLWSTGYAAYGASINGVGTAQTMYGFTGEPTDGSGLVHLRARYYNPALGFFPSQDPLETMNRYAYVEGNPVNRSDPSGLQADLTIQIPMPREDFMRYISGGAAAAAALCTGPQSVACAAIAGTALTMVGAAMLYDFLVSLDWDAYRAYEAAIAYANQERYPDAPVVTPGAPPTVYPDVANPGENPFAGELVYPQPAPQPGNTPTSTPLPGPFVPPLPTPGGTCTPTPTPSSRRVLVLGEDSTFEYARGLATRHQEWQIIGTKFGDGSNNQVLISQRPFENSCSVEWRCEPNQTKPNRNEISVSHKRALYQ